MERITIRIGENQKSMNEEFDYEKEYEKFVKQIWLYHLHIPIKWDDEEWLKGVIKEENDSEES